jgi:hypothetical protein
MRSKLAISALVVASLFGSTLIASAQSQPAPGASSEGNVGPGATSGKKTKHEKGMTTGSSFKTPSPTANCRLFDNLQYGSSSRRAQFVGDFRDGRLSSMADDPGQWRTERDSNL